MYWKPRPSPNVPNFTPSHLVTLSHTYNHKHAIKCAYEKWLGCEAITSKIHQNTFTRRQPGHDHTRGMQQKNATVLSLVQAFFSNAGHVRDKSWVCLFGFLTLSTLVFCQDLTRKRDWHETLGSWKLFLLTHLLTNQEKYFSKYLLLHMRSIIYTENNDEQWTRSWEGGGEPWHHGWCQIVK